MRFFPVWAIAWLVAVGAAVIIRPPLPVDETRYLAVAWEMWFRGDYLVPYLNGAPYHHKPPLLFWLMQAGWAVFGVNDWWPRLVAPLFALGALVLTGCLAKRLWPENIATARMAPTILVGAAFWSIFQTLTMFDMMLTTCALLAILGLVDASRSDSWRPWVYVALGIGIGVLAKGPAILLHILPVALSAPWWRQGLAQTTPTPPLSWKAWYGRLLLAVLAGAAIALCWAIPAGIRGGEEYRNMIFWGQSAGRIVESFDHARPFYWYALLLPPLLLPWLIWPRLWRDALARALPIDGAVRLLCAWIIPAFIVFSMISGKQLHYLLPEFPAFALLIARLSARDAALAGHKLDGVPAAVLFAVLGAAMLALPIVGDHIRAPDWFEHLHPYWGALMLAAAAIVFVFARRSAFAAGATMSLSMVFLVATVHLVADKALTVAYDLRPIAKALKTYEDQGYALANAGTYHGQYQFLGRLKTPLTETGLDQADTDAFVAAHPDGVLVTYYDLERLPDFPADAEPLGEFRFRDYKVVLWRAGLLLKYPTLADRT